MSDKLFIQKVTPTPSTGDDLLKTYFKYKSGKYDFHDKDDKLKGKDLAKGSSFDFRLDGVPGIIWTLYIDTSSTDKVVTGSWYHHAGLGEGASGDQTYQAQAGTPVREEEGAALATA